MNTTSNTSNTPNTMNTNANSPCAPTDDDAKNNYAFPPQHQDKQPGLQYLMKPLPQSECGKTQGKLEGKAALITGGDSGIGRAVAYDFVKEGAKVVIAYYDEETDAAETAKRIRELGGTPMLIHGDLKDPAFARYCIEKTIEYFGKLDILVNNHAVQFVQQSILDIAHSQLEFVFRNNVFSFFYLIQYALPYMKQGASIINTTSVTAYTGNKELIDYSATKGAIVALTRSLALSLIDRGIRVNGVAPGPIWTPLIPASYCAEAVSTFGKGTCHVPMNRAGQPCEVSPCYVFLASDDSSYMTGQILHPNGGTIVGS